VRRLLLGFIDCAHAAGPNQPAKVVAADCFSERIQGRATRARFECGKVNEARWLIVRGQERFDLQAEVGVRPAFLIQERRASTGIASSCFKEQLVNLAPAL
jgi:hypothetical protein